jgi:TonB family protein
MEKERNIILFMPSGCLTEKGLSLFAHGLLPAEETDAVRSHMQACEFCAMAAEGYMLAGQEAFAEDISSLNSGFDELFMHGEKTPETSMSDERLFETPKAPVMGQENVYGLGGRNKAEADSVSGSRSEKEPLSAGIQTTRTINRRNQYRLIAAAILLLAGFGSMLLYLQLKDSAVSDNAVAVIEKRDTISPEIPLVSPVSEEIRFPETKKEIRLSSQAQTDSGVVIPVIEIRQGNSLGYIDRQVVGLIDKSSYTVQEGRELTPSRGMPRAATPEAPQSTGNQKTPAVVGNYEADLLIQTVENEDVDILISNIDEKVSERANMKSITAEEENMAEEIFTVVEESPQYPGGEEAWQKYLAENFSYPQAAREASIQGTVYVSFVIEKDGSITEPVVLRGIGAGCDEEALRVIKQMPRWIPGKQRGKAVRVRHNIPFKFTLAG